VDGVRDGRYALQSFPQPEPGRDEFDVAGKAVARRAVNGSPRRLTPLR
jgi:hypothetical protein